MNDDLQDSINFNTKISQCMTYFTRVWIGLPNNTRGKTRKQPMFKLEVWNKYDAIFSQHHLCEAWNSVSKAGLNMHPNIWVVIDKLRREESLARSKLMAISPTSNKPDHKRRLDQRRKKAIKF